MSDTPFPPAQNPGGSPPSGWSPPPGPGTPPPPGGPQAGGWGGPPPGPGGQFAPPPGPGGHYPPQGPGFPGVKPPRPKAVVGGGMLIAAAVLVVLGMVLPWASGGGESVNGFDNYYCFDTYDGGSTCGAQKEKIPENYLSDDATKLESPGIFGVLGALVLLGFGIALVAAGRVVPVAILAVITAAIGVIVAIIFMVVVNRVVDGSDASTGFGIWLQLLAPMLGLAGGVTALVQKNPPAGAQGAFYG